MDYKKLLEMVEEEIDFLDAFELNQDPMLIKGMTALLLLREYVPYMLQKEESLATDLPMREDPETVEQLRQALAEEDAARAEAVAYAEGLANRGLLDRILNRGVR